MAARTGSCAALVRGIEHSVRLPCRAHVQACHPPVAACSQSDLPLLPPCSLPLPPQAANLLLDETGTVKIADFGVARVMDHTGIMTAETGTYRCAGWEPALCC